MNEILFDVILGQPVEIERGETVASTTEVVEEVTDGGLFPLDVRAIRTAAQLHTVDARQIPGQMSILDTPATSNTTITGPSTCPNDDNHTDSVEGLRPSHWTDCTVCGLHPILIGKAARDQFNADYVGVSL